jgi:hypothetical protein
MVSLSSSHPLVVFTFVISGWGEVSMGSRALLSHVAVLRGDSAIGGAMFQWEDASVGGRGSVFRGCRQCPSLSLLFSEEAPGGEPFRCLSRIEFEAEIGHGANFSTNCLMQPRHQALRLQGASICVTGWRSLMTRIPHWPKSEMFVSPFCATTFERTPRRSSSYLVTNERTSQTSWPVIAK